MKKITLIILLLIPIIASAQQEKEKYPQDIDIKHELKINTFSLIVFSSINVSYERIINKDSSYGIDVYANVNDDLDTGFPRKFSITPHFRWFFSEKFNARGFFVEGFGMLNTSKDEDYDYVYDNMDNFIDKSKEVTVTDFALGIAVGGKFITRKNFIAEVYLGLGRNLFNSRTNIIDTNIVSRGGISLGYRF